MNQRQIMMRFAAAAVGLYLLAALVAAAPPSEQVALTIDLGDGRVKQFPAIAWRDGMTVGDVMAAAKEQGLHYRVRGSGATAFITEIEGVKNEGAAGRNWIYRVNGKLGDRSFAVFPVRPGDKVTWRFEAYRPE